MAVIAGNFEQARESLVAIDTQGLAELREHRLAEARGRRTAGGPEGVKEKGGRPEGSSLEVFSLDSYVCCYCGRWTLEPEVMHQLSRAFPSEFPTHPNWKLDSTHIAYWTHTASIEHVVPLARGGSNARQNLRTACYLCQDAKSDILLDELGWSLRGQSESEVSWMGLHDRLAHLTAAVGRFAP